MTNDSGADEVFWNLQSDLLKRAPEELMESLLDDDAANRERTLKELSDHIGFLDRWLTYALALIQGWYRSKEEWQESESPRAMMAMATDAFNYLLLTRHAITMGYYGESQGLIRDAHERTTRALLFLADEKSASAFLRGKQLSQSPVDSKLAELVDTDSDEMLKGLRGKYDRLSELAHPNLRSLIFRTVDIDPLRFEEDQVLELGKKVGLSPTIGGLTGEHYGQSAILHAASEVQILAGVLRRGAKNRDGVWRPEYDALVEELERRYEEAAASAPTG